jgi:hypothetical protein
MILATARCPACHTLSEYPVDDAETFLTCFGCAQKNPIAKRQPITGRCMNCGQPIDGHGHTVGRDGLSSCKNQRIDIG